jgi:hypothetical protein
MPDAAEFLTGVIEGFYGRGWSHETRLAYADFLVEAGLNTCIYCPKGDAFLRRRWREDWPAEGWRRLCQLSGTYTGRGLNWGVGLSPVELYRSYGASEREELRTKVARLGELSAPLIAILFDDMPGDLDALAERQAEIVSDVCNWLPGVRVLACPTYYSYDPVLEKFFGDMPPGYWPDLGRLLPREVGIFWTGPMVCSEAIDKVHLESITGQLGRRVILWDNYPVNDGGTRCDFLYTDKLSGREAGIESYLSGHLCNPMNQGLLSLPALAGLSGLYGRTGLDEEALARILGPSTWRKLSRDRYAFQHEGLSGLGESRRAQLLEEYAALSGPAAREIAGWLRGEYAFDPACLTG